MLRKTTLILLVLALLGLSLVPAVGQDQPLRIAFSVPGLNFPFFVHMQKQIEDEAANLGVELIPLDGRDDTTKQIADVESVIAEGYDGLIISPRTSEGLAPTVQDVIDAGIPVITIDRTVAAPAADNTLAHVGADNVLGGEAQGQLILDMFPDGASIFNLQGTPGASPAIDRNQGLHNVLDGAEGYEIVFEQTANFNRNDGLNVTENGLTAQDNPPDVISAANDDMALGVVEALKARGLVGEVAVLGFDALPEALLSVKNGELTGTVEQFPGGQARTALNLMVDYLKDGTEPAEHNVFLTPKMITIDNLDEAERIGEIEEQMMDAKPLRIAFSVPGLNFPFFVHMQKQIEDEAAKLNIELVTLDGRDDTTKQIADVESVIAEGYDGLIISPRTSEGLAPTVQDVIDAGIPVITIDRTVAEPAASSTLAHVGADNVLGGEAQGQLILDMFPDGATIFNLQGTPGASPAIDRNQGLHNVLDGVEGYEITFEQTAEFNRAKGLDVTENGLTAQDTPPDVISAANDDMALGVAEALKARGLVGEVAVLGFDALPEALLAVKNGELTGTVEQFPGGQARTALNLMADYLREGTVPAEHNVFLTPKMITIDNLDEAERIGEIE